MNEPRPALAAELLRRADIDQEVRHRWIAAARETGQLPADHPLTLEEQRIDADNTAWLKIVIEASGWPLSSVVGQEAASAAWLLVQHSAELEFKIQCLGLMRDAAARGEARAADLALLEDRVRLRQGRPQVYGTQWQRIGDGDLELCDIEDPEHVDERRAQVGLPPLSEAPQPE